MSPPGSSSTLSSPTKSGKSRLPSLEDKALKETQDMLDAILPPRLSLFIIYDSSFEDGTFFESNILIIILHREWAQNGDLWIQHVSSIPATRADVITLQEQMDTKLQQRQARETGICPVRRELYSQCFGKINF